MLVSSVLLTNWRNFAHADIRLHNRTFLIGPNASGKSNFLDSFRFLKDIAKQGGGLQKAIEVRGGLSKIRCLAARQFPEVVIHVKIANSAGDPPVWEYALGIRQEGHGKHQPLVAFERITKNGELIRNRPDEDDSTDKVRLTQTHLEQVNANREFRPIAEFFDAFNYLHLVPQILRYPKQFGGSEVPSDPFGRNFLRHIAQTPANVRHARLRKIEEALRIAVPQLSSLIDIQDDEGNPHLQAIYSHWRSLGANQREDQFSDGTLRLIGLLWSLLEGESVLLLEEPELSLNSGIVSRLPGIMFRLQKQRKKGERQIIISTHSPELLSDHSIIPQEVLLLRPDREGTRIEPCSDKKDIVELVNQGMSIGEAALPHTLPDQVSQLELFK
jgi:predicted ATPase